MQWDTWTWHPTRSPWGNVPAQTDLALNILFIDREKVNLEHQIHFTTVLGDRVGYFDASYNRAGATANAAKQCVSRLPRESLDSHCSSRTPRIKQFQNGPLRARSFHSTVLQLPIVTDHRCKMRFMNLRQHLVVSSTLAVSPSVKVH